jgi:5-methylcytosine-specific restriction endonuclease McrA
MREPRPGLAWSAGRIALRARYASYMESEAWQLRRQQWLNSWTARHDRPPACAICGCPWTLAHGDLHHRSYRRLGQETTADLVPLCRACHTQVHTLLESSPPWRRLDRAQATDMIVALLRRRARARQ